MSGTGEHLSGMQSQFVPHRTSAEVAVIKLRLGVLIPRSVGPSVGLSVSWSVSPLKITTNYKNMGVIWARYN